MRITRVLTTAALAASTLVVASAAPSAAAPTVGLSATSGPPGTRIEVTAADCMGDGADVEAFLLAQLIVGTAPNERLAGAGNDSAGTGAATIVVPDWVDPAEPATIETTCFRFDFSSADSDPTETDYEPAAFDIEPSVTPSVETRTFSRTSLQVGQGLRVTSGGCTLPGADYAVLDLARGSDLSGRDPELVLEGFAEVTGASFATELILSNGGVTLLVSEAKGGSVEFSDPSEVATDITPGTYSAFPYCASSDEILFLEPERIEVTGTAPIGALDLTSAEGSRDVTLVGTDAEGTVDVTFFATSSDAFGDNFFSEEEASEIDLGAERSAEAPGGPVSAFGPVMTDGVDRQAASTSAVGSSAPSRALVTDDLTEVSVEPDASGAWSLTDSTEFDHGVVEAYVAAGDPFGDGFFYDPQIVVVDARAVAPPAVPVTPSNPGSPRPASPANAVPGRPDYAG